MKDKEHIRKSLISICLHQYLVTSKNMVKKQISRLATYRCIKDATFLERNKFSIVNETVCLPGIFR